MDLSCAVPKFLPNADLQSTASSGCAASADDCATIVACFLQAQQYFPRDGSRATPPHPASNFKWKDYCPKAFNKLRATFHIDPADYMLSICGTL